MFRRNEWPATSGSNSLDDCGNCGIWNVVRLDQDILTWLNITGIPYKNVRELFNTGVDHGTKPFNDWLAQGQLNKQLYLCLGILAEDKLSALGGSQWLEN